MERFLKLLLIKEEDMLKVNPNKDLEAPESQVKHPLVLLVLDGVGLSDQDHGNVVKHAHIPNLRKLMETCPFRSLKAHGKAVGLPSDNDMGNSEVGHNALGSGQIYAQGAQLVNQAIDSGVIFKSPVWQKAIARASMPGHSLHFLGLLSDGNVHSHINHLKALIEQAKNEGVERVAIHALLDGRDVAGQSAETYIEEIQDFISNLNDDHFYAYLASGGGRMQITMDRYEADWSMVERGWHTHVEAKGIAYPSALAAIEFHRENNPDINDQDLPPFVIPDRTGQLRPMQDGDACILFNFRGDRSLEIARAFDEGDEFVAFERNYKPDVYFAGLLEYDGDLHVPKNFLVNPPSIQNTLTEEMAKHNLRMYALSETQKFGHVTYFWNGNRQEQIAPDLETWQEIESDRIDFAQKPWMKAYEITEALIQAMENRQYDFLRVNFPNGDMVGHTGNYQAATIALETVDLCLSRIIPVARRHGYTLMILADHGNCEEMLTKDRKDPSAKAKTAHTLSPVPFIICGRPDVQMKEGEFGLANVAGAVADLLNFSANSKWEESPILVLSQEDNQNN